MAKFGERSLGNLKGAHSQLRAIMDLAIKEFDFTVADGGRGRFDQERAFANGFSKVHFGDSAHNYVPWIALDVYPYPIPRSMDTKVYRKKLRVLQMEILLPAAKKLGIPIRQGIDFNRNGILTDDSFVDLPHIELHPWREFAKKSKLFEGKSS